MDYFCQACAARPGWEFDAAVAFRHSCQRCFQMKECNDYGYKTGRTKPSAAPLPKDLVKSQVNPHAEVALPKVKGHKEAPPKKAAEAVGESEADKALAAVQPNRPGIKMEKVDKSQVRLT
jgi:hypothetical protein